MPTEVPLFDLEACARKFRGVPDGDYLGKDTPTLVTAEALANNLGLDATNGPDYVKAVFEPLEVVVTYSEEETLEAEAALLAELEAKKAAEEAEAARIAAEEEAKKKAADKK